MASFPASCSVTDTGGGAHTASAAGVNPDDSGAPSRAVQRNGSTASTEQRSVDASGSTSKSRVKGMGSIAIAARRYFFFCGGTRLRGIIG